MTTELARTEPQTGPPPELTEAVSEALLLMGAVLANPKPHGPLLVKAWAMALHGAGIVAADIGELTSRVMSGQTFFPTPADFIAAATPDADTRADAAWLLVLAAVSRVGRVGSLVAADVGGDGAALWAIGQVRWERLCSELGKDGQGKDTRPFFRSEFKSAYRVALDGGKSLAYLPGAMALQNDGDGRALTPALVGRPDWAELPAEALAGQGPREEFRAVRAGLFSALLPRLALDGDAAGPGVGA